jgi:hypothetical protein
LGLDYRSREKYFHKDGCNVFCLAENFRLAHETSGCILYSSEAISNSQNQEICLALMLLI